MDLIELLTALGASDDLIALAQRFVDSTVPETEGDAPVVRDFGDAEPLTDDELDALRDGLVGLADNEAAGIELLNQAADVVVAIDVESDAREQIAETAAAEDAAARARLRGDEPEDSSPEGQPDGDESPDPDDDDFEGDGTDDGVPADGDGAEDAAADPVPVTAGATTRGRPGDLAGQTPRQHRPRASVTSARTRITFAAGVEGHSPGSVARDLAAVDAAITERLEAFAGSGDIPEGVEEKIRVARVHANYDTGRQLVDRHGRMLDSDTIADRVSAVMRAGLDQDLNQLAAGGFCAPFQPLYGVEIMGSNARPIRDTALAGFQAARGGVISLTPPRLAAVLPAVGIWDETDDIAAAEDPPEATKTCLRVTCGTPLTSKVEAFYVCLLFGNLIGRTFSEWTNAWSRLSMVGHARVAEQRLFALIQSLSTTVNTETTSVSATRDVLNVLGRAAWAQRSRNRELATFPFRVILPEILLGILAEDIANGMPGGNIDENLVVAQQRIMTWFAARRLNVTWSPDLALVGPQGAATALADYPTQVPYAIYPEGTFLHLDTGTLDLGIVRDSTLNSTNDYKTFVETFEGVHRIGAATDSLTGLITVCPSGASMGTLDPAGRCASYT